jgi:hypothetical protein
MPRTMQGGMTPEEFSAIWRQVVLVSHEAEREADLSLASKATLANVTDMRCLFVVGGLMPCQVLLVYEASAAMAWMSS